MPHYLRIPRLCYTYYGHTYLEQHGFALARVSTGKLVETGTQMRAYIKAFPSDGYWGQVDMWFARDAALLRRASPLMRARKSYFDFL